MSELKGMTRCPVIAQTRKKLKGFSVQHLIQSLSIKQSTSSSHGILQTPEQDLATPLAGYTVSCGEEHGGGRKKGSQSNTVNSGKLHLTVFCTIPRTALINTQFHFYTRNTTKRQQTLRNNWWIFQKGFDRSLTLDFFGDIILFDPINETKPH